MMLRIAALCVTAAVALCSGCERADSDSSALASAIARATPHATAFSKYETWVARALSIASPDMNQRALAETLFAPIRNDDDVLGVMVAPRGQSRPTLTFPTRHAWTEWSTGRRIITNTARALIE